MNKKGFTLIELLAVIVILAIIALIAVPSVLNIIEDSKKGAAEASARNIIGAARTYYMQQTMNGNTIDLIDLSDNTLKYDGEQADKGVIEFDGNGKASGKVYINGYCVTYNLDNTMTSEKMDEEDCVIELVAKNQTTLLSYAQTLVYDSEGKCDPTKTHQYMDGCYLFGEVTNNYVWYNGFLWRIMGINADNSIRMITEENMMADGIHTSAIAYFNESKMDKWLNEYFYGILMENENLGNLIVDGKYCERILKERAATMNCDGGTLFTRKVGIPAVDEIYHTIDYSNEIYYSYLSHTGQTAWTMSTSPSNTASNYTFDNIVTWGNGKINQEGVRPVINLSPDSPIYLHDGSLTNYHHIGEEKVNKNYSGDLASFAKVGEYVKFGDKLYRVIKNNGTSIKLALHGFYEENGEPFKMYYGPDNTFTTESRITADNSIEGVGYKLNTDVLNWLTNNDQKLNDAILVSNWYQTEYIISSTYSEPSTEGYSFALDESGTPIKAKVGLLRKTEILSANQETWLNESRTPNSGSWQSSTIVNNAWMLTTDGNSVYVQNKDGSNYSYGPTSYENGLRPVINIDNSLVTVSTGNGMFENPYIVVTK